MLNDTDAKRTTARKIKLRMRFKDRLDEEISSTEEKLRMLREIQAERANA